MKKSFKKRKDFSRKTFTSVENAIEWLTENPNTFIELTLESETF
jgi:exonuclease SbcD